MSTSCEMNDRPAELSEIRGEGVLGPQTFVDQHRDLVLYPLGDRKPVQFSKDRCNVVEFTSSDNHPCRGVLNSLELPNDAISNANQ